MSNAIIAVQGSVVSSIDPRRDVPGQVRRIMADHLTRFRGVPVAVYLPNPGADLPFVQVDGHLVPVVAGWPTDPAAQKRAYLADHAVAVVYPGFDSQAQMPQDESPAR